MVTRIENKRKGVLGYLVDTVYIPNDIMRCLTSSEIPYKSIKLGKESKNGCKIENKFYKNLNFLVELGATNYLIELLYLCGITLRDVIFFQVNKGCLEKYNLESDVWKQKFKGCDIFSCYSCYGNPIGVVAMKGNYIVMLETFKKGSHYGKHIVNELKNIHGEIKGMSLVNSKRFWLKQGADFSADGLYFSIKN